MTDDVTPQRAARHADGGQYVVTARNIIILKRERVSIVPLRHSVVTFHRPY